MKKFAHGARQVAIVLADTVESRGFKRVIGAIDSQVKEDVASKAEEAFKGPKMLSEEAKSRVAKLRITQVLQLPREAELRSSALMDMSSN